tara:strand:- start:2361 stop:3203 length:843 start_codon:yes stop_codon:yes gene_type:complete
MGSKSGTKYKSKEPDHNGIYEYTAEENEMWSSLYNRQKANLSSFACKEYISGLADLNLPENQVPQLAEITNTLSSKTGWGVKGVPALISFDKFFDLLASKKFPAATFIRTPEDFKYLREPDIFHEIFGHCPLLTNQFYANFMQKYGELGKAAPQSDQAMLARLYWFTVEFGLIKRNNRLEAYGSGIVSSIKESEHALSSNAEVKPLNLTDVFRTLYRIDKVQPIYFFIESFEELYNLVDDSKKVFDSIIEAKAKGPFLPKFEVEDLPEDDFRRKLVNSLA